MQHIHGVVSVTVEVLVDHVQLVALSWGVHTYIIYTLKVVFRLWHNFGYPTSEGRKGKGRCPAYNGAISGPGVEGWRMLSCDGDTTWIERQTSERKRTRRSYRPALFGTRTASVGAFLFGQVVSM